MTFLFEFVSQLKMKFSFFQLESDDDLVFVNKPRGLDSSKDSPSDSIQQLLEQQIGRPVQTLHRLDRDTTGAMIFSMSLETTQKLSADFKDQNVKKTYQMITSAQTDTKLQELCSASEVRIDRISDNELIVEASLPATLLPEQKESFYCQRRHDPEALMRIILFEKKKEMVSAKTHFKRLKGNAFYNLWQATPSTERPNQIRLHASMVGMPILGDRMYGGIRFPHRCLHSQMIEVGGQKFSSEPPAFFGRMGLIRDQRLCEILSALDFRQRLYDFLKHKDQSLRLMHLENPSFKIDLLGRHLWVYWYADNDPMEDDFSRFYFLSDFLQAPVFVRQMKNRGKTPTTSQLWARTAELQDQPYEWITQENQFLFYLRNDLGLSPGLFLDQRENRHWVFKNSSKKKVLNLFAYTCGFSVAAADGGAAQVVSVDTSKKYLEHGKRNFQLNQLGIDGHLFFARDSFEYLQMAAKKNLKFDLIICDPPSFSRSDRGAFSIEKDFQRLIQSALDILTEDGALLFSTNLEKWTSAEWENELRKNFGQSSVGPVVPKQMLDFEKPDENLLLKTFLIRKKM